MLLFDPFVLNGAGRKKNPREKIARVTEIFLRKKKPFTVKMLIEQNLRLLRGILTVSTFS